MSVVPFSRVNGQCKDIQTAPPGSIRKSQSTSDPSHENGSASHSHYPHRVQLFSGLSEVEMKTINAVARRLRKERGEFVYMPGDRANSVYFLSKGRIKLSVLSDSGKEIAIDIIQAGEMFGEFALIDESLRSNMTQALDDVTILVFNKQDFVSLLRSQSNLALNYIRMVGDRRRRMEKKLSDITSKEVPERVCELLHELAAYTLPAQGGGQQSLIPLMHQDVASLIGASRQTTTSILNDLMRRGFIELGRGWIRIKSLTDLRRQISTLLFVGLQVFLHLRRLADIPSISFPT
jgi:CRP/FNR family transcriptional regulator, cyclic AMP receptor protein